MNTAIKWIEQELKKLKSDLAYMEKNWQGKCEIIVNGQRSQIKELELSLEKLKA